MSAAQSHTIERVLIVTLVALAVIAFRVVVGNPVIPEPPTVTNAQTTITIQSQPTPTGLNLACAEGGYVTGDLVGAGNPAEVHAALCPR